MGVIAGPVAIMGDSTVTGTCDGLGTSENSGSAEPSGELMHPPSRDHDRCPEHVFTIAHRAPKMCIPPFRTHVAEVQAMAGASG
ncbi:hypothetical protein GCM10023100_01060 [Actinocorallia cavernae]|uniref:Uncharacterized protein n=1 Tax=Actinocorallia cavernae TaxID=328075 RepID=A0ABP8S8H7_9ACTN